MKTIRPHDTPTLTEAKSECCLINFKACTKMTKNLEITLLILTFLLATPLEGQTAKAFDIGSMFEIGALLDDTNNDGFPNYVNAALIMSRNPSPTEIQAASEISLRLGFETMAMDLPIHRGFGSSKIPIFIGTESLAENVSYKYRPDLSVLRSGQGHIEIIEVNNQQQILLAANDKEGLIDAARVFAGILPHSETISSTKLDEISTDIQNALKAAGVAQSTVSLTKVLTTAEQLGIHSVSLQVKVNSADSIISRSAIEELISPKEETSQPTKKHDLLRYKGIALVEVNLQGGTSFQIENSQEPPVPGPIPSRPGRSAKNSLDLSNIYTSDGILGDSDNDIIPDRVDAMMISGSSGISLMPDLAGRIGMESTGITVPFVEPAVTLDDPSSQGTLVLVGTENTLTTQLADSGKVELSSLEPGEGLIQIVPEAFSGDHSAVVLTGADQAGADRAIEQVAITFPHIQQRGKGYTTIEDVEEDLWSSLSGHSPVGQAAIGIYKLNQISEKLSEVHLSELDVTMSLEKVDPGLADYLEDHAKTIFDVDQINVTLDDRDVQNARTLIQEEKIFESELEQFWNLFNTQVLPKASGSETIEIYARLSEPPELRTQLENQIRESLVIEGLSDSNVKVKILSAFKQGYSWLNEVIAPQLQDKEIGEIVINFMRNDPPKDWPQQAINTPVRWLHEIFPIDEVFARDLELDLDQIRFNEVDEGPTYSVEVLDPSGVLLLSDSFDPKWVLRPYFDRFQDYEKVRVTTGWIEALVDGENLLDQRIITDPETFWNYYQETTLPAIYDYVMELHKGLPLGGDRDAPFFGELTVELNMSEPDYRIGIDNEIHAPMDALHEEIYFGTIEFFDILGRNSRGEGLLFPGRIVPIMRPRSDGRPPSMNLKFTGFATSRPAVVVNYLVDNGTHKEIRLDIPKTTLEKPSARLAKVKSGATGLSKLALRVRTDTEHDLRDSLITVAATQNVDRTMVSASQIEATVKEIERLHTAGLYLEELAYPGLESLEVWAEWNHRLDPSNRRTAKIVNHGSSSSTPSWETLLPPDWKYTGERMVQWETPMPPSEGHEILAKMSATFPEATMYHTGKSYLGKDIWAMDLMPEISQTHWSHMKASAFKPTVIYSARQHANEVSSTSHVLRHAELILTDSEQREKLNKVNVIIHPFTNPDGAQTAYDLYKITPDYILHAGYLGPLGRDITSGSDADHPIYPESKIRGKLWETWLPDIFLNPHGYPSHQVVQLFSEYMGLVRQGRVTERNWGFNKGWFMPGFNFIDSPDFPRHKDAAFQIRDHITSKINSNNDVFDLNQRMYARYQRYGADYDPETFRLPMIDSVLIEMPLKGSQGTGSRGYNPRVTIWSGTTEAPDETAYGPYMELVAKAGLSWDEAILDYLYQGNHQIERNGSKFFGGVSLKMKRPRPPKPVEEKDDQ